MPEYLAPSVYIEEVPFRSHEIPGVDTSTCAELIGTAVERLHFFSGQVLSARDLESEQRSTRERMRRHNRLLHGRGVVCGLLVSAAATAKAPWRVRVGAGVALSRWGDEITLAAPVCVDLAGHRPGRARRLFIAVRYGESLVRDGHECFRPAGESVGDAGDAGEDPAAGARIREAIVIGCLAQPLNDPWTVLARISLPASSETRLSGAAIDNASVRRALHGAAGMV